MSIRVALIDDQDLVREGIKSLLALSGEVAVLLEGRDGDALLDADLTSIDSFESCDEGATMLSGPFKPRLARA